MRRTAQSASGQVRSPVILAKVLRGILNCVDITQRQRDELLRSEALCERDLRGVAATIGLNSYMRIFNRLAQMVDEPTLGLDISGRMGPELVGAIGYVFLYSPSLATGIRAFTESVFSIQGATRFSYEHSPRPTLIYAITDDNIHPSRHDVEFSLGYVHALMKAYLGGKFAPQAVYFEHARPAGRRSRHEAVFGCPVFFQQDRNALVLGSDDVRRASANSDSNLIALLQHYIRLVGEREYAVTTLAESINQVLSGVLETQRISVSHVAARLGMSKETLRRELKREGTCFRDIARRKRIAIAKRCLSETRMSVLQVAQKVGYSETASFTRAFTHETGQTPSHFRRDARIGY